MQLSAQSARLIYLVGYEKRRKSVGCCRKRLRSGSVDVFIRRAQARLTLLLDGFPTQIRLDGAKLVCLVSIGSAATKVFVSASLILHNHFGTPGSENASGKLGSTPSDIVVMMLGLWVSRNGTPELQTNLSALV